LAQARRGGMLIRYLRRTDRRPSAQTPPEAITAVIYFSKHGFCFYRNCALCRPDSHAPQRRKSRPGDAINVSTSNDLHVVFPIWLFNLVLTLIAVTGQELGAVRQANPETRAKGRCSYRCAFVILKGIYVQLFASRLQFDATRDLSCRSLASTYGAHNPMLRFFSWNIQTHESHGYASQRGAEPHSERRRLTP
jgi:hypothetical protein